MKLPAVAVLVAVLSTNACGGDSGGPGGPVVTTGSLRGTVNDQNGAAVQGASVSLTATGQSSRSTTTGSDGGYSFSSLSPGAYTVGVTAPLGFTGTGSANVTVVVGQQAVATTITLTRNPTGPPPQNAFVSMVDNAFSPQSVEVAVGGTVTWTNNGGQAHNATGAGGIATGNMNPGQSRDETMLTAGTFAYECTLHAGMTGTVIVR